jgi:hypothetical protein
MGVVVAPAASLQQRLPQVLASLRRDLPAYALPLFLRAVTDIDTTGQCLNIYALHNNE